MMRRTFLSRHKYKSFPERKLFNGRKEVFSGWRMEDDVIDEIPDRGPG